MSRFIRASKYRHVFGQPSKKESSIENVKVTQSAWDTNLIESSGLYVSLNWAAAGGGAFAILPIPSPFSGLPHGVPYKLPDIIPLARGHTAPVLDVAWSPFNDSVCVSGGEDGKILVWKVEGSEFDNWGAEKWVPRDFDPVSRISGSARKIGQVIFHPTAAHVFASASGDYAVKLWSLESTDDPVVALSGHTDTIQGITFNYTGSLIATTCRDRKIRLFDARAGGDAVRIADGHSGIKGSRIVWMGDRDRIATTGFSKMSDRQLSVWETGSLKNINTTTIDQSSGTIMPFWSDNSILFLAGKGDGNIRYYEYEADAMYPLAEYKSSDPQRGMAFSPRRALNVGECEIARAFKVAGSTIEPIAFIVPRKSDSFQSDIFPAAPSLEPALTAAEFFTGKSAQPNLVDLDTGVITSSTVVSTAPSSLQSFVAPTKTSSAPLPSEIPRSQAVRKTTDPSASVQQSVVPVPAPTRADSEVYPTSPVTKEIPPLVQANSNFLSKESALAEENSQLQSELRDAKARIRNLELQVETMRANAQRAATALME